MNIFDSAQNMFDQAKSQLTSVKNTLIPMGIQNLKTTNDSLDQSITQIEQQPLPENNQQALDQITHLRTALMTHFGHLIRGGDPEPVIGAKNHPIYIEARNGYINLDNRLSALEKKYFGCTFGYQSADGQILKLSLEWTEEQWTQIRDSARDQVARCWLDADKNQYR